MTFGGEWFRAENKNATNMERIVYALKFAMPTPPLERNRCADSAAASSLFLFSKAREGTAPTMSRCSCHVVCTGVCILPFNTVCVRKRGWQNLLQIQWTHIRMGFRGQDSRADEARANMITFGFRVG